jgi:hypothetical protein
MTKIPLKIKNGYYLGQGVILSKENFANKINKVEGCVCFFYQDETMTYVSSVVLLNLYGQSFK